MSFGKCCTPKQVGFWGFGQREEKCSIKEKAEIEHTYAALRIVAESQGKDITEPFKELYKECCYLRILMNWQIFQPLTEEEKAAAEKREKEFDELCESSGYDFSDWDFDIEEEDKEHYQKIWKFVEIMSSDYENITEEMKKEVFGLFPEVFGSLGNFGEYATCDGKKVL